MLLIDSWIDNWSACSTADQIDPLLAAIAAAAPMALSTAADPVVCVWPGAATWQLGPAMLVARRFFSAVVVADGRVVVAGGQSAAGQPLRSAEVYDPGTGCWQPLPSMATARFAHAAALLPDGRVGVFGTHTRAADCEALQLWTGDAGGEWSALPPMRHGRAHGSATLIAAGALQSALPAVTGGGVLIAGGTEPNGAGAEVLCWTAEATPSTPAAPFAGAGGADGWRWHLLPCEWPAWVAGPTGQPLRECAAVLCHVGQLGAAV